MLISLFAALDGVGYLLCTPRMMMTNWSPLKRATVSPARSARGKTRSGLFQHLVAGVVPEAVVQSP